MLIDAWQYLPAILYLVILASWRTSPSWAWYAPAAPLLAWNIWCNGFLTAGIALAVTAVLFGFLLVFPLNGKTVYGITLTALSVPVTAWGMFIPGLALAGGIALLLVYRTKGSDYVRYVTAETFAALGASGTAATSVLGIGLPSPDRLPLPDETVTLTGRSNVSVLWCLAAGITATAVLSSLL